MSRTMISQRKFAAAAAGVFIAGALFTSLASAAAAQALTDGKPDFTGIWTNYRAANVAGAFTAPAGEVRLNPIGQKARDDYLAVTEGTDYAPGNSCVGSGMPSSMLGSGGYPMEWIQRPEQITVIYEAHTEIRRIFLDERAELADQAFEERNGFSTAHWDGDRLIVETTRLKTQVDSRYPHSDQAHITEIYYFDEPTEAGLKVLVAELTMTDPLWLTEPFTTVKRWQEVPNGRLLNFECTEPDWLDELQALYDEAGLEMVQE